MTAETSNARGEWPERYACNGPEGTFWTDDAALANKLIGAAFDRDEWTVTDTHNPTGAAPSSTAETSNARGEWVLAPREPSAGMWDSAESAMIESECAYNAGDPAARSDAHGFPTMRIWQAVVGYRAMLAAAPPPPAAARGDVRGLVAKCRAEADAAYVAYIQKMDTDECRGWEAKVRAGTFARANLDAFTAAAELLGRHRALHAFANRFEAALAADGVQAGEVSAYDLAVLDDAAETLDRIGEGSAGLREARARIASALSQQPEARGGGEVVAWFPTNGAGEILRNYGDGSPVYACRTKEEAEQAKRCHLGATGPVIPLYAAPPLLARVPFTVERPAAQQQQGQAVAWADEWRAAVAAKLSSYGLSEEAAAVFASSELDEYKAGLCDCAENDPVDMVDLMMGVARDAIEKWKIESAGRPFGHKNTAPPPSAPVGVELSALRVQEWLHREHDILCPVQEIEQAMRTPCSCPFTERALAQQPAAVDEAMVERAWVAFCENNGSARQGIRAALTAALTAAQQQGQESGGEVIQRHVVTKYRDGSVHVADVAAAECPHDWGQDEAHEDWARCYKCGISRRKPIAQQPAAVDEARNGSSIMDGAVSFVEALAAQRQEPTT